jgi:hypothetical protein
MKYILILACACLTACASFQRPAASPQANLASAEASLSAAPAATVGEPHVLTASTPTSATLPLSIFDMFAKILAGGIDKAKADLQNGIDKAHAAGDGDGEQCWASGLTWVSGLSFASGPPAVGPVGLWEDARLLRKNLKMGLIPPKVMKDCAMVRLDAIDAVAQPIAIPGLGN